VLPYGQGTSEVPCLPRSGYKILSKKSAPRGHEDGVGKGTSYILSIRLEQVRKNWGWAKGRAPFFLDGYGKMG